jgi:uncharacterized metal-binding protein
MIPGMSTTFLSFLFCLISGASCIFTVAGSVSADTDSGRRTAAVLIVDAVYGITVYLQTGFRGFKEIFKRPALIFLKAGTTGTLCIPGSVSVYQDRASAAALICIVHTVFH